MSRGFISYRHVKPDEDFAFFLQDYLVERGHKVFIDKEILVGTKWVEETERQIKASEFFVILLSKESIRSDLVRHEVELAHRLEKDPNHNLLILPIRVNFSGELPYDLGAYLSHIQYTAWNPDIDSEIIAKQILEAIDRSKALPQQGEKEGYTPSTSNMQKLANATEAVGAPLPAADPRLALDTGTIKLTSPFYVRRDTDSQLERQMKQEGTTIVVKGPRQIGKSSLLARAHAYAKKTNQKSFYIDFQFLDKSQMENLECLSKHLARKLARAFNTSVKPDEYWDDILGPKDNLTDFIEEAILSVAKSPISN